MYRDLDMEIAVDITGRDFPGTITLEAHAHGRICRVLDGFPGAADRAAVTVRDRGDHVYQCRLQLWLDGEVTMVVHVEDVDPVTGVNRAADRVRRNLVRNTRRRVARVAREQLAAERRHHRRGQSSNGPVL